MGPDLNAQHCGHIPYMPACLSNQDTGGVKTERFFNRDSVKYEGY